ncbi:M48 family metalloprotease [Chelativorans sp. ZYF759]|uniref:zinc metalloprotease HtpX n=1 Tax=Chelativorans sp. ZYF759 TaxID=2692213 RepID=UPI00145E2E4A|nr:zinc metalloprotease HtpX [Chelativorans sp. ZYF759]NMG40479.1 M48 family metalloprotease [Chelativorans sp. ZYF759]
MNGRTPSHPLHGHRTLNIVHTWLLAAGSFALLAVTAYVFAGGVGVVMALAFGTLTVALVGRVSPKMVLAMYKAAPVPRQRFPEGHAIIDELAARAGLPAVPKLHVVPSRMLNAFAVGRREDSAIAVTDGLIRALSLRELAGVLAHEVSHIAHEDLRVMAFADMVSRYTSFMSTFGILTLFINIGFMAGGYEVQVPWIAVLILVLSPTIGGLLQMALSRTREFDADLGAAQLTGDPDGLASALVKLETAQRRQWEAMMLPGGRIPDPSLLRTHPPTDQRVARLMSLKVPHGETPEPALPAPSRRRPPAGPSVPIIPRAIGRRHLEDMRRIAEMLERAGIRPIHGAAAGERPAGRDGLCQPERGPRLRIRRGGVWW